MTANTVILRGFAHGKLKFEERLDPAEMEGNIDAIVESHGERLTREDLHMIEMEFTGLPESERFFRFGTDPRYMVAPILITKPAACGYCHGTGQICSSCSSSTLICTCGPQQSPQACSGCKGTGEA